MTITTNRHRTARARIIAVVAAFLASLMIGGFASAGNAHADSPMGKKGVAAPDKMWAAPAVDIRPQTVTNAPMPYVITLFGMTYVQAQFDTTGSSTVISLRWTPSGGTWTSSKERVVGPGRHTISVRVIGSGSQQYLFGTFDGARKINTVYLNKAPIICCGVA